jgi:hypothetical protein
MQNIRQIIQLQYQCGNSLCKHAWWSTRSDITRCPNCQHRKAIPIPIGQEPSLIDQESHYLQGKGRRKSFTKYRQTLRKH